MSAATPLPHIIISLDDLLHNCVTLRSRLPPGIGILAVVKDRAYGCGSRSIAEALERYGKIRFFAVNDPAEAFFLRRNGIKSPILVLGTPTIAALKKGTDTGIRFTLNDLDEINVWKSAGVPVRFHCQIDTRMHRMGILPDEMERLARSLEQAPRLHLEGIFTHLADADDPGSSTVREQLGSFAAARAALARRGIVPPQVHCANSAGIMHAPLAGCTLVRPGIALYGCKPDPARGDTLDLQPILSLKSSVVKIQKVPRGTPVSYGGTYVTRRETYIATIPLGYGVGFPRSLGNKGNLIIGGKRYRIRGTITMDYCMVDAGSNPLFRIGDEVIAIGRQGNERITPDDIALLDHTIGYEVLCRLSSSLERTYLLNSRVYAKEKGYIH